MGKNEMIYFITYSRLPENDSSAVRITTLAKIFKVCNKDLILVGMGDTDCFEITNYAGMSFISLRIKGNDIKTKLKNYFGFKKRLKSLLDNAANLEAIVLDLNSLPINVLFYIKKFAKRNNVRIIVECCEWYSPQEFKIGRLAWQYLQNIYVVQKYIDKTMHIIAISKYLTNYFKSKKYAVDNIPVVLDVENINQNKSIKSEKLVLMYAGKVGRKDYLDVIIKGLSLLSKNELAKVEFRIFGATLDEIKNSFNFEISDNVYNSIKCYGRVAREEVLRNLQEADFTVLMRSATQRYAKAGFPTKVVESLASATPVICNLTSDLIEYIFNDYNGVVVNGESAEDFSKAVKKALNYSVREKENLSKNARTTAEKKFDYRLYKDKIAELIKNYN